MRASHRHALLASALAGASAAVLWPGLGGTDHPPATPAPVAAPAGARPAAPAPAVKPAPVGTAALVIDRALLDLFNFYLLERGGPQGAADLRLHLRGRLNAPAYREADALLERYLAYMSAHDALLAAQALDPSDLRRMAVWCDQRARLRQRLLGPAVTEAWYGQEQAQLRRILAEAAAPDELITRTALDRAARSFAELARDEPLWRRRLDSYLAGKSAIMRNAQLDDAERGIQTRELLLRSFASEADRFRARSLETD